MQHTEQKKEKRKKETDFFNNINKVVNDSLPTRGLESFPQVAWCSYFLDTFLSYFHN